MRIATDVDQVLLDFVEGWRRTAEDVLELPVTERSREFSLYRRMGLTSEEGNRVWDVFHASRWGTLPVFRESLEVLREVAGRGYAIHAVTSVPHHALLARRAQLAGLLPGILVHQAETLHHCGANGCRTKEAILRELDVAFYADDRWPHCAEAVAAGVPAVFRVEGGHDGNGAPTPGVPEVPSLAEALRIWLRV